MALPCQHEQLRTLQNFASKTGPLYKELLVLGHSPSNSLVSALNNMQTKHEGKPLCQFKQKYNKYDNNESGDTLYQSQFIRPAPSS
jgi:hypothetical protein